MDNCYYCNNTGISPVGPFALPGNKVISQVYCELCSRGDVLEKHAYFPGKTRTYRTEAWIKISLKEVGLLPGDNKRAH